MPNPQSIDAVLPAPPADPAWDEAFLRVEGYLCSYGLESRVLLNQITASIIEAARARAREGDTTEPVPLAMEITHARIGEWFARTGQPIDWADERMRARGRLALVFADLPGRWANHFLSPEPVPPELASRLTLFQLLSSPEMRVSAMPPATLEFGFLESDTPRPPNRRFWPPFRALISWMLIVGFFGIAWAASH
jgi:hypothetical protein